ncbi:MAG: dTMP kinase, partial [Candidatus Nanopelagicaceae bacterium]
MASAIPNPTTPSAGVRQSVLSIPAFRRLWNAMAFSSFGDWLGLLATTALAQQLAGGNYATANFAIAGVFIARLLPSVILGPLAGVIADKFDRKKVMVVGDILRALLFLSIPIVGNYFWLYTATVLIECVTLFWSPAKEATVPNIVPKNRLENANQVSLFAAYGTAPIAAILFSLLSIFITGISAALNLGQNSAVDLALYINALSFLFSAYTISQLEIPNEHLKKSEVSGSMLRSLLDGGKFVSSSKIVRGLIVGLLGAFVAAGAVIGLARTFVGDLAGGDAAYGVLFSSVFTGLAAGIALGPKVFAQFSRRRLFGAALTSAGFLLIALSLLQNLVLAIFVVVILGFFSGVSWVTGFTMLGMEVTDELRGRVFAFIQSLVRVSLVGVLAVAPLAAAAIGEHDFNIGQAQLTYNGAAFTMLGGGFIAMLVGILSYHQMKDRPGVSFWSDIVNAFKGELGSITAPKTEGLFISFEGGEGSGKSTQSKLLKEWFENEGRSVVLTREPGGTTLGKNLRKILLDNDTGEIAPRSEALLYAADRAHHVYTLIRPALERGDVVITDRYFDSS